MLIAGVKVGNCLNPKTNVNLIRFVLWLKVKVLVHVFGLVSMTKPEKIILFMKVMAKQLIGKIGMESNQVIAGHVSGGDLVGVSKGEMRIVLKLSLAMGNGMTNLVIKCYHLYAK